MIADMCLDHTGDFVYCAALVDSALLVIDTRVDSVVVTVRLPPSMAAKKNSLVLNRATGRLYEAQTDVYRYGDVIPVIHDSMLVGVEELASAEYMPCVGPTVVSRGTPMRVLATSELWDATGRRVAVLRSGPNDINHLAPGVYFVRQASSVRRDASSVTKVVVTR
jgi:hypothetical protein